MADTWYVVQVKSGDEHELRLLIENRSGNDLKGKCFVPLYEEVRRSGGKCNIYFRRLFPGYIFVESDNPQNIFENLKKVPEFTKLLGTVEDDGTKLFIPIGDKDREFLQTLFTDGMMHVSYVHMAKNGRIDKIVGPLANYKDHITKLEMRHRMAVVEAEMFGKKRKVRFGLWTDDDPTLPQLQRQLDIYDNDENNKGDVLTGTVAIDIGIHVGDKVVDETGIYGEQIFTVEKVDAKHRTVISSFEMYGTTARIELRADDVKVI